MIAVLNGSTSANWNGGDDRPFSEIARMPTKTTYLIIHSRSCSPKGISICLMPSRRASWLVSSCSVPNGQSQPQKSPRQNEHAVATKHHSRNTGRSSRNCSQWNPDSKA